MIRPNYWVLLGVLIVARVSSAAPPNIVFIFSDDHAYQAISAYQDPRGLIETPHIDRLAREGMRFDRCVVPNSICGPSRATVLTGQYSHRNGFYNNTNSVFDGAQTTFPKLLQAAGYQTALIGKWHLVSEPTGFDHWQILPGQGDYYRPAMIRDGKQIEEPGYVTDIITDRSLEWLAQRDPKRPFLLMMQHKATHRPWEPPVRLLGHDHDRKYPEPSTLTDDFSGRGIAEREQQMTLAGSMKPDDLKLVAARAADGRGAEGLGCLLRAAERRVSRCQAERRRDAALALSTLHARLSGVRQSGRRERGARAGGAR